MIEDFLTSTSRVKHKVEHAPRVIFSLFFVCLSVSMVFTSVVGENSCPNANLSFSSVPKTYVAAVSKIDTSTADEVAVETVYINPGRSPRKQARPSRIPPTPCHDVQSQWVQEKSQRSISEFLRRAKRGSC